MAKKWGFEEKRTVLSQVKKETARSVAAAKEVEGKKIANHIRSFEMLVQNGKKSNKNNKKIFRTPCICCKDESIKVSLEDNMEVLQE